MVLAVPVQDTFTVGEVLTSAAMNKNVRDAVNFLSSPPMAILYQATAQSWTSSTSAKVSFDSEITDTYSGHSNTTNNSRYTAQVAGWYLVIGTVDWQANTAGNRILQVTVNGSLPTPIVNDNSAAAASGQDWAGSVTDLVQLNVGDYAEINGQQSSGSTLTSTPSRTSMIVIWMHS